MQFSYLSFLKLWNIFVPLALFEVIWPTLDAKASFISEVYLCSLLISWRQLEWYYLALVWLQTHKNLGLWDGIWLSGGHPDDSEYAYFRLSVIRLSLIENMQIPSNGSTYTRLRIYWSNIDLKPKVDHEY